MSAFLAEEPFERVDVDLELFMRVFLNPCNLASTHDPDVQSVRHLLYMRFHRWRVLYPVLEKPWKPTPSLAYKH